MTDYRVSVITRTFNRPKMLRRALESIAAQTWEDKEVVVINDGGEDVEDIVRGFEGRLDVVYLSFPPDEKPGRCVAATKGIEASTGRWIAYCDDDDVYFPDHLETLMTAAKETGAKVLYTDGNVATEEPTGVDGEYEVPKVEPGPSEDFSRVGFYQGCYIHLSTFCHLRSVFDEQGGFDPELLVLEDLDLYFRYAFDHPFHHVPERTTQWAIRTDNTNAVTSMRKEFEETNRQLARKYLHIAVGDLVQMLQQGHVEIQGIMAGNSALMEKIERLEARVAELEGREK